MEQGRVGHKGGFAFSLFPPLRPTLGAPTEPTLPLSPPQVPPFFPTANKEWRKLKPTILDPSLFPFFSTLRAGQHRTAQTPRSPLFSPPPFPFSWESGSLLLRQAPPSLRSISGGLNFFFFFSSFSTSQSAGPVSCIDNDKAPRHRPFFSSFSLPGRPR